MNNFGIGDIVGCKPSSNGCYNITCERNGYIGRVVNVSECGSELTLRTVYSKRSSLTRQDYSVDKDYFYILGNEYTLSKLKKKGTD